MPSLDTTLGQVIYLWQLYCESSSPMASLACFMACFKVQGNSGEFFCHLPEAPLQEQFPLQPLAHF